MRDKEIIKFLLNNGYEQKTMPNPFYTVMYKLKGDKYNGILVINNSKNDIEYQSNLDEAIAQVKDKLAVFFGKEFQFMTIICTAGKRNRRLEKIKDCVTCNECGKFTFPESRSSYFINEYKLLMDKNALSENYYRKHNAFADETTEHIPVMSIIFTLLVALAYFAGTYFMKDVKVLSIHGGGISVDSIIKDKEYYRLFTYIFVHAGFFHVLYNVISLYSIGRVLETQVGWIKFTIIFAYGGIMAACFSMLVRHSTGDTTSLTVGASGAVYAVAGALVVHLISRIKYYGYEIIPTIVYEVVVLVAGFMLKNVDSYAHVGGFIGGIMLQLLFIAFHKLTQYRQYIDADTKLSQMQEDK